MTSRHYPEGIDCVWLASDENGHAGAFITAGEGPIPAAALDRDRLPVEDVERRLGELPRVSHARLRVSVPRPDSFVDLAERGLFVYDWTDVHRMNREAPLRAYAPVAVPTEPITTRLLPADLQALAEALALPGVTFAAGDPVDVRARVDCVEAD